MIYDRKPTKAESRELAKLLSQIEQTNEDVRLSHAITKLVPDGWRRSHERAPCQPKTAKMTIRLEADVLAWYRKLGRGYQNRINEVLRAYMHAMNAKLVEQPGDRDWQDRPI